MTSARAAEQLEGVLQTTPRGGFLVGAAWITGKAQVSGYGTTLSGGSKKNSSSLIWARSAQPLISSVWCWLWKILLPWVPQVPRKGRGLFAVRAAVQANADWPVSTGLQDEDLLTHHLSTDRVLGSTLRCIRTCARLWWVRSALQRATWPSRSLRRHIEHIQCQYRRRCRAFSARRGQRPLQPLNSKVQKLGLGCTVAGAARCRSRA